MTWTNNKIKIIGDNFVSFHKYLNLWNLLTYIYDV
jgi:hypothetical protein